MRDEFLRARLGHLLERLSPPRSLLGNAEAQRSEMRSLVSAVIVVAPRAGWDDWWPKFEGALLDRMTTRAWPTRHEIRKAAQAVSPGADFNEEERKAAELAWALSWSENGKPCPPWFKYSETTLALIERGVLRDEREARFRGWPMSHDMAERARDQRMGRDEWQHHVRVMARMRDESYGEAEAKERQTLPNECPELEAAE